jgi:hypothetical protein
MPPRTEEGPYQHHLRTRPGFQNVSFEIVASIRTARSSKVLPGTRIITRPKGITMEPTQRPLTPPSERSEPERTVPPSEPRVHYQQEQRPQPAPNKPNGEEVSRREAETEREAPITEAVQISVYSGHPQALEGTIFSGML